MKRAGRNRKEAADYFSHDADASSDEKLVYLENLFGHMGYAVYFKFLERMARSDNFEIEWNDIKKSIYASEFNISVTEIEQIVTECCREEIKAFKISGGKLFSTGLKKRMLPLIEKRNYNRLKYKEKKVSVTESNRQKHSDSKGKERKGKYSKEKESKEDINISGKPKKKRFTPPLLKEDKEYCTERENNINPDAYMDHYIQNG